MSHCRCCGRWPGLAPDTPMSELRRLPPVEPPVYPDPVERLCMSCAAWAGELNAPSSPALAAPIDLRTLEGRP